MSNQILTLQEAKTYLRIDHNAEDEYIKSLIITAEEHIKNVTRSSLKVQTRTHVEENPENKVTIPDGNVIGVKKVMAVDDNGIPFQIKAVRNGNEVMHTAPNVPYIEITYDVYDDHIPEPLKQAALLLIAHLYENRGVITDTSANEIPFAFQSLVAPYRKGFF